MFFFSNAITIIPSQNDLFTFLRFFWNFIDNKKFKKKTKHEIIDAFNITQSGNFLYRFSPTIFIGQMPKFID